MRRRSVLRRSLALATVAVAGCSGDGDGATETPTDEPGGGEEPTATGTMEEATATSGTETAAGGTRTTTAGATDTRSETPDEGGTSPTPPTETSTPTETPTPTGTPTPTEAATPTPPQADRNVEVGPSGDLRFDPEEFEIAVGETVRWVWRSSGHNVKPDSIPGDSDWSGTDGGEFNTFSAGYEYTYTFETPGTYEYVCKPHESAGMTGSFTVTE
jgi:plastocyanin